jgi:cobalt-zinc-cadmium efflux system membrane fusion protein
MDLVRVVISSALMVAFLGIECRSARATTEDAGHSDTVAEEVVKGPHNGRVLKDGEFSVEIGIVDLASSARFRVYATDRGRPIPAAELNAQVVLRRLGGATETISFEALRDYLSSTQDIAEPHSFDVEVSVTHRGGVHRWEYSSYEGRTEIPESIATASGIRSEVAGPQVIKNTLRLRGKIAPSEHRIAHVIPRFAGVVREGKKHIGDTVAKGEVMAIVESNQSLQPFEVRAQISGTVVQGHLIVGEYVAENQWVYVIADLSEVWADFFVPLSERDLVRPGQAVEVRSAHDGKVVTGTINYVAPYADERSQSQLVRVVLANDDQEFVPGMFVTGDLVIAETQVPVAVRKDAVQSYQGWQAVFFKSGDIYEARPVKLGRSDDRWIEVVSGLSAGSEYVSQNTYTVKADILKSGASHDH